MNKPKFFCIRGYMKSGTNWICRIMNAHPEVDCIGEFHWENLFHALDQNVSRIAPKRQSLLENVVRPELEQLVRRSLQQLSGKEVSWIGDRTPTTIAPIVLADAPHIVVVRDFRDVIVSRMFHLYNHPRVTGIFERYPELNMRLNKFQLDPWYFKKHPLELVDHEEIVRTSAREWMSFLQADRNTVQSSDDIRHLQVRYEDLHQDFENQVKELFNLLNLAVPDLPPVLLPGHGQENPNALDRKGEVGDWKNYLGEKARSWINDEIFDELKLQNYVSEPDW